MMTGRAAMTALWATLAATSVNCAAAQTASVSAPAGGSAALRPLLACREVADRDARLACFDREAAVTAAAIGRRDIFVADQKEIKAARRSLFGLQRPGIDVINKDQQGKAARAEEGVNAVELTIRQVSQDPYGHWFLVLDDGARWRQIDEQRIARDPRPGMPIRIRRAAMGSFLANIDKQTAIRVRRVR